MPAKVWVGRFAIVDGKPQEEGPFLRSFPRQRPDEEEDELYVLVEPVAEGNREYYSQLVDAIGRMYQQDTLSITGAVLRAIQAAHKQLRDWNSRTLREQHVAAGVTGLAVRGRTAYLAQVGPAVGYHVGDGHFSRVTPEVGAREALGTTEIAEPTFNRYALEPGDLLLIASTGIENVLDEELLRSVLLRGGDDALVELFRLVRDEPEFSLVLLACVVEPDEELPADTRTPLTDETEVAGPDIATPFPEPPVVAQESEPGTPEDVGAVAAVLDLPPPPIRRAGVSRQIPAPGDDPLIIAPAGLGRPDIKLKGASQSVDYRRPSGLAALLPNISPIAVAITLILIIAGLLAWQVIPRALEDSREERFQSRVERAESALNAALSTTDAASRRELLAEAQQLLEEAESSRPGETRVRDLNTRVEAALNELNAVLVLPDLEQIVDITGRVAGPVSSKDLAIGGGGAYFLDRDQGRVIGITLLAPNPEPFVMYQEGDLVGTEITGRAHSIAWAEDLGVLLISDDQRRLIAVRPPATSEQFDVRGSEDWGSEDGIGHAAGSLYVLDKESDQVWRYPSSESGFDSEREGVLPAFDAGEAVEMAAGEPLYLLLGDGSIVSFAGGVAQPFSQAGIDRPLSSPGSIIPVPGSNMLLVADRGNARIVVFSQDGVFRQQLVSPRFTDLRAIAVDEQAQLLYILNSGALYRTPLPALP